jgi:signal transduction histidine kinase
LPVPQKEWFNIVDFLQSQIRFFNETNHTEILLHTTFQELELFSDLNMIGRAITNLMLNAIQTGPNVQVLVQLSTSGGKLRLSIEDNGPGIPEELQSKIFTLFFTTKSGGSGIGLAMLKRDMEALGGRVWFETETGKGTRFEIELPLA